MFILMREYEIDGYFAAFTPILSSVSEEKLKEKIVEIQKEKEDFLFEVEKLKKEKKVQVLSVEETEEIFRSFLVLSKFYLNYWNAMGILNFEIEEVECI